MKQTTYLTVKYCLLLRLIRKETLAKKSPSKLKNDLLGLDGV
jgi:hypothetical protein